MLILLNETNVNQFKVDEDIAINSSGSGQPPFFQLIVSVTLVFLLTKYILQREKNKQSRFSWWGLDLICPRNSTYKIILKQTETVGGQVFWTLVTKSVSTSRQAARGGHQQPAAGGGVRGQQQQGGGQGGRGRPALPHLRGQEASGGDQQVWGVTTRVMWWCSSNIFNNI